MIRTGYLFTVLANLFGFGIQSVGAHLTLSMSGIFFMGFPVTFAASAYTYVIAEMHGFSIPLSLLLAILAALLVGLIYALLYIKMSNDSFAVVSLTSIIGLDALLKSWTSFTGGVMGLVGFHKPHFLKTIGALALFSFIIWISLLLFDYLILKTPFGRRVRALKESSSLVAAGGYSPKQIGSILLILASIFAGIAGIIEAWKLLIITPSGFTSIINLMVVLTIAILAMKPKLRWLVFATIFVILLPEAIRLMDIPSTYIGHIRNLIYGAMLLVLLKVLNKNFTNNKRKV